MPPPSRRRWTLGGAAILCVAMGSAVQSCAVMTSSSDCASKADCPDDDANSPMSSSSGGNVDGSSGSSSSSGGAEAGSGSGDDDGGDATFADVTTEATPSSDARGDAVDGTLTDVIADVVSEDSTLRDVVSEANVDAPLDVGPDVAPDVAVDAPGPTGDGCIATVENCTNGIDDTCDGKIDCADPACTGFTCASQVPTGWTGPALLWLGASTATPPACPGDYRTQLDGHEGPTGTPDTCGCSCTPGGQVCAGTGTFHNDQACAAGACVTGAVSSASTACTNLATNICGTGGSFEVNAGNPVTPTGGTCSPQMTTTAGSPEGWTTSARICGWAGVNDTPGGCNPMTGQCVGASPGSSAGFAATVCVFQSGDVACPAAYPNNRNVVFSSETDTRTCAGCTCTTASPNGGSCAGTVTLYGAADCGGTGLPYTLGTRCLTYNNIGAIDPASIQAAIAVTAGTCTVATQATAAGGVTGTGPTTVCCM